MSGSVATVTAVAGAVATVTLWAVVFAPRVPRAARMPVALTAFASAWGLCYLMLRLRFPTWATVPGTAAVLISMVLVVAVAQISLREDAGGEGTEGDDGGGGMQPPDRPIDRGGPAEPSWWPEFERDLADYLVERERAQWKNPVAP